MHYDLKHDFQSFWRMRFLSIRSQTPSQEVLERAQPFGRSKNTGPEFLDHPHRISVCLEKTNPEFLENKVSFVLIRNTISRVSGVCAFFRYDPNHRLQKFWNVHSLSVDRKTLSHRISGPITQNFCMVRDFLIQNFWNFRGISVNPPEFLEHKDVARKFAKPIRS